VWRCGFTYSVECLDVGSYSGWTESVRRSTHRPPAEDACPPTSNTIPHIHAHTPYCRLLPHTIDPRTLTDLEVISSFCTATSWFHPTLIDARPSTSVVDKDILQRSCRVNRRRPPLSTRLDDDDDGGGGGVAPNYKRSKIQNSQYLCEITSGMSHGTSPGCKIMQIRNEKFDGVRSHRYVVP